MSGAASQITLAGSSTVDVFGSQTGNGGSSADGLTGGTGHSFNINSTTGGNFTFNGSKSDFTGGVTLTAGTLTIGGGGVGIMGAPTSGPVGTGTLTLMGGTLGIKPGGDMTLYNNIALVGPGTINYAILDAGLGHTLGPITVSDGPTLNINDTTGGWTRFDRLTLNSDFTISGSAPSTQYYRFLYGLTIGGGAGTRTFTVTFDKPLDLNNLGGPLTLNKGLTITGAHAGALTMTGFTETIVGPGGIALTFSDTGGATTYTTGPLLLGGDFTLTGNATKKPIVTINGIRVANGVTSNFTLDNANTTYSFGLDTGTKAWIVGGNLTLTYGTPGTGVTISGTNFLVGGGNLTFANGTTTFTAFNFWYRDLAKLFTGTITVGSAATVNLSGGDLNRGPFPPYGALALATSGTPVLDINNTANTWVGSLSGGNASLGIGEIKNSGASSRTLVFGHDNRDATYSGKFTATTPGNLALEKRGTGTQTFDGSVVSTFTGGLTVNGGTLKLDFANLATPTNLLNSGNGLGLGGGTLFIKGKNSGSTSQTLGNSGLSSGGSAILIDPFGGTSTTLTLGTISTGTGATLLVGTTAGAGAGTAAITTTTNKGGQDIYNRVVFTSDGGTTVDWATTASGSSPYTLSAYSSYTALATGAGTDTANSRITANTSMSGARTTNTLKVENPAASQSLDLNGTTLTLTNNGLLVTGTNAFTIKDTGTGGNLTSGGDLVVNQYNTGGLTISTLIGGTTLTKSGPGALTLSANNQASGGYTGATYLNGGILSVGADNNLSSGTLYFNGGTIQATGNLTTTRTAALSYNGGTVDVAANMNVTLGGLSAGGYQGRWLTKTGAGSLTLGAAGSYVSFLLSGGQLNLNDSNALGGDADGLSFLIIAGDGTVKLDNTSGTAKTMTSNPNYNFNANFTMVGAASGTTHDLNLGTSAVMLGGTGGNRTITVGDGSNVGTFTVGGAIHDGGNNNSLTKAGAGTLVLPSTASTYSGGTTLSAGTLAIGNNSTGTLDPAPAPGVVYGPVGTGTLTLNGGTLCSSDTGARIIHNALAISGVTLGGDTGYTGSLDFRGVTTLTGTSSATLKVATTFGALSGSGTLNIVGGAGSLTVATASSGFTGAVKVSAATFNQNAGMVNGMVIVNGGTYTPTSGTALNAFIYNSGTFTLPGTALTLNATTGYIGGTGTITSTMLGKLTNNGQGIYGGDPTGAWGTAGAGKLGTVILDTGTTYTLNSGGTFYVNVDRVSGTLAGNRATFSTLNLPTGSNPVQLTAYVKTGITPAYPDYVDFATGTTINNFNAANWTVTALPEAAISSIVVNWTGSGGDNAWVTGNNWDLTTYGTSGVTQITGSPNILRLTFNGSNGSSAPLTSSLVFISAGNPSVTGPVVATTIAGLTLGNGTTTTPSLTLQGSGVNLTVLGNVIVNTNSILTATASALTANNLTVNGTVSIGSGSTISGMVAVNNGSVFNVSGGTIGTLTITGGNTTITGGNIGTTTLNAATGSLAVNGGTIGNFIVSNTDAVNPTVGSGATLNSATIDGSGLGGATVSLGNTTAINTLTINGGTVARTAGDIGTLSLTGGSLTLGSQTVTSAMVSADGVAP